MVLLVRGGHGRGNDRYILLEQDGAETRVEGTNTLVLQDLGETTDETVGKGWVTNKTDTGSLERAEGNVGEELSNTGGSEVDGSAVVGGGLVADQVDGLLLEELITTELEGTLEEVTSSGRTETSPDGAGTLVGNDFPEATDQAGVVLGGVQLYPGLDAARDVSLAFWRHFRYLAAVAKTCAMQPLRYPMPLGGGTTYTSTGVRAPWVTEQQTAPAKAKREYRSRPVGAAGWADKSLAFAASILPEPVAVGGGEVAMVADRDGMSERVGEWRVERWSCEGWVENGQTEIGLR